VTIRAALLPFLAVVALAWLAGASHATAATVLVSRCPTTSGVPPGSTPRLPLTEQVPGSASALIGLRAYATRGLSVLAPAGWRCHALQAADGGIAITVRPRGTARGVIAATQEPACVGCIGDLACGYFPAAAKLAVAGCPSTPPPRERTTRLGRRAVAFADPPGVRGGARGLGVTPPAGLPTRGIVIFRPGAEPSAAAVACALPAARSPVCATVVDAYLSRYPA
jgi:hypothetical protein